MYNSNSRVRLKIVHIFVVAAISLLCFTKASGLKPLEMDETWKYYPPGTYSDDLMPNRKFSNHISEGLRSSSSSNLFNSDSLLGDQDLMTDLPLLPPNPSVDSPTKSLSSMMDMLTNSDTKLAPHSTLDDMSRKHQMNKPVNPPIGLITESPDMVDIEASPHMNVSETLFRIPKVETSTLTKLITGPEKPTFFQQNALKPQISRDPNSKVLASYRVVVPIYIPAIKSNLKMTETKPKVEYTKETHVKMVPVEKEVVSVNKVIKAEPVPQDVVTEFYTKPKSDGILGENQPKKVIMTTIQKFV